MSCAQFGTSWGGRGETRGDRLTREAADVKRASEAEAARQQGVDQAALAGLIRRIEWGDITAMQSCGELLPAMHGVRVLEQQQMPEGIGAYAHPTLREIVVPPITDDETFAVRLHELGHCLSEACSGGDHYRDPTVRKWWHCVRCEVSAWERGLTLVPFSREMFARLQRSLAAYRLQTPAPPTANAAADRLKGTVTWCAARQRRLKFELAQERQAAVMATVDREAPLRQGATCHRDHCASRATRVGEDGQPYCSAFCARATTLDRTFEDQKRRIAAMRRRRPA